jgi:hypothetical protein
MKFINSGEIVNRYTIRCLAERRNASMNRTEQFAMRIMFGHISMI